MPDRPCAPRGAGDAQERISNASVVLLGWRGAVPDSELRCVEVSVDCVEEVVVLSPTIVALGDSAIERIRPTMWARFLREASEHQLLVPTDACYARVCAWFRAGIVCVVCRTAFDAELASLCRQHARETAVPTWVSVSFDRVPAGIRHALLVLDGLDAPNVNLWGAALGVSRHVLRRRILKMGTTPQRVVTACLLHRAQEAERTGASAAAAARVIGLSGSFALKRARARWSDLDTR